MALGEYPQDDSSVNAGFPTNCWPDPDFSNLKLYATLPLKF